MVQRTGIVIKTMYRSWSYLNEHPDADLEPPPPPPPFFPGKIWLLIDGITEAWPEQGPLLCSQWAPAYDFFLSADTITRHSLHVICVVVLIFDRVNCGQLSAFSMYIVHLDRFRRAPIYF